MEEKSVVRDGYIVRNQETIEHNMPLLRNFTQLHLSHTSRIGNRYVSVVVDQDKDIGCIFYRECRIFD